MPALFSFRCGMTGFAIRTFEIRDRDAVVELIWRLKPHAIEMIKWLS
jgi:hypothetical protein